VIIPHPSEFIFKESALDAVCNRIDQFLLHKCVCTLSNKFVYWVEFILLMYHLACKVLHLLMFYELKECY